MFFRFAVSITHTRSRHPAYPRVSWAKGTSIPTARTLYRTQYPAKPTRSSLRLPAQYPVSYVSMFTLAYVSTQLSMCDRSNSPSRRYFEKSSCIHVPYAARSSRRYSARRFPCAAIQSTRCGLVGHVACRTLVTDVYVRTGFFAKYSLGAPSRVSRYRDDGAGYASCPNRPSPYASTFARRSPSQKSGVTSWASDIRSRSEEHTSELDPSKIDVSGPSRA